MDFLVSDMICNKTKVDFSEGESAVLGLKVGRCNSDDFNAGELYRQIIESKYDLCRLKVPAEDEFAPLRLNKIGIPFFFSGSIRKYKTKITEYPAGNYNYPDLVWEQYDGTQNRLLKDMLVGTWGNYPLGYYRSPYVGGLVTKEKEIEAVFQFYRKHNFTRDYPDNSIVFIKHGENYVGFFALNRVNGNLESHIGGILAPYRKGGYFLDKLRYIKHYCVDHQLNHFIFGARNENAEVQRIFQFVGFQAVGSENVFHIPSLLTYSKKAPVIKKIKVQDNCYSQFLAEALTVGGEFIPDPDNLSLQLNYTQVLQAGKNYAIRFSVPVITSDEALIVIRGEEEMSNLFTGYLRVAKA